MSEFAARHLRRIDWWLLGLTIVLLATYVPRFSESYVPLHDSLQVAQVFHFTYSGLVEEGRIPQWMPYSLLGSPAAWWQLTSLSPPMYFAMLAGLIFHVRDALVLFKIGAIIEHFFLMYGLYLLCGQMFRHRQAVVLVCLGAILAVDWRYQIWWNLRIAYLLPLGLYCLLRFFNERRGLWFWLAGATFAGSLIGNLPYYAPLYVYGVALFVLIHALGDVRIFKRLFERSPSNVVAGIVFILIASVVVASFVQSLRGVSLTPSVRGRDSHQHGITRDEFLTYGGKPSGSDMAYLALAGWPTYGQWSLRPDATVYVGLLPLFFAVYALIFVRSIDFIAIGAMTFAFSLLAIGGVFASIVYYLPGMNLFRHIGLLWPFIKILVLICAGFGVDRFLSSTSTLAWFVFIIVVLLALASAFNIPMNLIQWDLLRVERWRILAVRILIYLIGAFAACLIVKRWTSRNLANDSSMSIARIAFCPLLACFVVDLVIFYFPLMAATRLPAAAGFRELWKVRSFPYRAQRTDQPTDPLGRRGEQFLAWAESTNSGLYQTNYEFLRFASSRLIFFTPLAVDGVVDLLCIGALRDGGSHSPVARGQVTSDPEFSRILGFDSPRLRLVRHVVPVPSTSEALAAVQQIPRFDDLVVLTDSNQNDHFEGAPMSIADRSSPREPPGSTIVRSFNCDDLTVEADVTESAGAWLVYAEAFHPDWRAEVDNLPEPIFKAYGAMQAVHLPKGKSKLRFEYHSHQEIASNVTFALAAAGTLSILVAALRSLVRPRHDC